MPKPTGQEKKLEYTFKNDVLFKMLFVRNPHLLKRLAAVLLGIPVESIADFQTLNTEMPPEEIGKRFCRLDIHMLVDGKRVNLEIQVEDEGNYPERVLFHWAKMFTTSLPAGDDYALLPKTIVISILGFKQFDCADAHSEFAALEVNRHEVLSEKMRYHFYELPKLPALDVIDTNSEKALWLALFNAETEEALSNLEVNGGEVMAQAIEAYRNITAEEEFKYAAILRARARHDEAQAIRNAERRRDAQWQSVVAERDTTLAEQRTALAERDTTLSVQSAQIEQLRQELAALRAKQGE